MRHAPFRGLWGSGSVYFIGNVRQTMAAAWMMVELTGSSFLAALVQTAVFLPMFLFALPAGVLADTTDRQRLILILIGLGVQAVMAAVLAVLVLAGMAGPATLLFLAFVAGSCTAVLSPAWNSAVGDSIPRAELPQAITAVAVAYNAVRAPRRRDGATFWRVYRDLGDPSRYVERFIVASWADCLHQRWRVTVADQDLELRVRALVVAGAPVTMQHYIAER